VLFDADDDENGVPAASLFNRITSGAVTPHSFSVIFSLLRGAAIIQGAPRRRLDGNAAFEKAFMVGHLARLRAQIAWRIVETKL
jgi:hypothetical protein